MRSDNALLRVERLQTAYVERPYHRVRKVVDDVAFALHKGQIVGLVGESGSGKTQTALSITGLVNGFPGVVSGVIDYGDGNVLEGIEDLNDGQPTFVFSHRKDRLRQIHLRRRMKSYYGTRVSMIFQDPKSALVPYQTVLGHVSALLAAREPVMSRRDIVALATQQIVSCGINNATEVLDRFPYQLSGGEAQRIMILLATLRHPNVMLADEPTTSLDTVSKRFVVDRILQLAEEEHMGCLFISHDLHLLGHIASHIVILYNGSVVESGHVKHLFGNSGPKHPYSVSMFRHLKVFERMAQPAVNVAPPAESVSSGCKYLDRCALTKTLSYTVQHKCRHDKPRLLVLEGGHDVACWAYEDSGSRSGARIQD